MKVYLIAGEASGDKLGAALISALNGLVPGLETRGIGGALMQDQGLQSLFPMHELSVMGLAEILPKYRALKARIKQTARHVVAEAPDVLVTIDSPEFCHRVNALVREMAPDIRIVHYVAPSVWAWRPGRAEKMARHIDHVLALLPFEPPFMERAGMRCDFVGHPVVAEAQPTPSDIEEFRAANGLGLAPLTLVLPGSRQNEVSRLAPIFGKAIGKMKAARPDIQVLIPAARNVVDMVRRETKDWPVAPIILDPNQLEPDAAEAQKRMAMAAADVAIAASGTVSLELAAANTPMVIAYDMHWLSWQILSRMVKLPSVTLINLISETNAVPEFLGPKCEPGPIADAALDILAEKGVRQAQLDAMTHTMRALGKGKEAPGLRAARAILDGLVG